ncbi:hypothetical protein VOLCADRAFT_93787 [Volvox carteri f. nagariensis]|uniref:FAD-binding domain-containing protein n=1 Tax=Volvox carteri f. nagariensis TaxID=3068 RepID=D8U321_VOLCA|nr:uncharacterized protein VOLCADRAFT_93787 [Volvox carteri f. nagariensis]EFJ46001.1 hypothetical protein VOLCADRAFT_93787 [Volvox carteri f. nagariensis]|eukprot:XP_002953079.1 hypothetical protein VOLCADRAFT_93787 [Volvox carteri f. nagariensis]
MLEMAIVVLKSNIGYIYSTRAHSSTFHASYRHTKTIIFPSKGPEMSSSQSLPEACDVVIVGAGPAGLATALLLAQQQSPRWERIVLLEKRPSIDAEEADKSYTYMIDGRGFSLTDSAGVTKAVEAAGVICSGLSISRVYPDGTYSERRFNFKDSSRASVWLPRRAFLRALHSGLAEAEQQGRVRIMYDAKVTNIELAAPGRGHASAAVLPIAVHVREAGGAGRELCFTPRLLVGADGAASEVRQALELWAPTAGLPEGTFSPVVLDSPSAGLRYKVLNLPPNPPFRTKQQPPQQQKKKEQQQEQATVSAGGSGSSHRVLPNSQLASVAGIKAPRQRAMQLGMLPFRDPSSPRTANVIAPSDHVFWTLDTGEKLGAFLQASLLESFPQLDVSALFNEQQLEAAAKSRGGSFPRPQYMRHFIAVLPYTPRDSDQQFAAAAAAASSSCGVVLLGDAIHCFPPDLGQGVNSAMQDVMEFAKALHAADGNLARALPLYEGRRAPEAAALAEIMTFGAPYQYSQDKIQLTLCGLNVILRMFLHRLAPKVFSQQTFVLIQQAEMSYAQIRDQVHATTRRIWALVGALAVALGALAVKFALAAGTGTLAVA